MVLPFTERRRDQRRCEPRLMVRLTGLDFMVRDWSLGGLAVIDRSRHGRPPRKGQVLSGQLGLRSDRNLYGFEAEIIRVEAGTGIVAMRFREMRPECFELLEGLLKHPEPPPSCADEGQLTLH